MALLDFFFPKFCLECKKSGKYICEPCLDKVRLLNKFDSKTQTFSIFKYQGVIRKAIIKIKYNFAFDITKELADVCASHINNRYYRRNVILIPIPLHKKRENWRGFNQSEILGKLLAKKLSWGFDSNILTRPIASIPQVGLPKSDRERNIRGKFAVNSPKTSLAKTNVTYVIFDDVATTGSTLKEAIKVLKESGTKKVLGLTIAK